MPGDIKCPYCDKTYASEGGLRNHRKTHPEWNIDKVNAAANVTNGRKKCGLCTELFSNFSLLLTHLREEKDMIYWMPKLKLKNFLIN